MVSEQDGSVAIDEVEAALRAISSDSSALSRLAVISTLRLNGEAACVCELTFQLTRAGRDVRLEVAVYPDLKQKADLVVAGEVFETQIDIHCLCRYRA